MATRPDFTPSGEDRVTPGSGTGELSTSPAPTQTEYRNFYGEFDNSANTGIVWRDGEGDIAGSPGRGSGGIQPTNDLSLIGLDPTDSTLFTVWNFMPGTGNDMNMSLTGFTEGEYRFIYYNHENFFTSAGSRIFAYLEVNGIQFAANHDPFAHAFAINGNGHDAYKLEQVFNIGVDGAVNFRIAANVNSPKIAALAILRNAPAQFDDVYIKFPGPFNNATTGIDWARGTDYVINNFGISAGPNSGESFQGPVENLVPPLDPTDQPVVESVVWSENEPDIQIQINNVKAGLRDFNIYACQFNAPPVNLRSMSVDLQSGETTFPVDMSDTNEAVVGSGKATIVDQGDGYGTVNIVISDVADNATIAGLTILDPPADLTELHLNAGVLQDLTDASGQLWTGDQGLITAGTQDTTQFDILNMPPHGLDPDNVNDQNIVKSERRGSLITSSNFSVENGYYGVKFLFREAIWTNANERLIGIKVKGVTQTLFDIVNKSSKKYVLTSFYTTVQVLDNVLNFELDGNVGGTSTTEASLSGVIFKKLTGTATGQINIRLVNESGTPYASLTDLTVHVYDSIGGEIGPMLHHEPKETTDASGFLTVVVPFQEVGKQVFFSVTDNRPLFSVSRLSFMGAATLV